jgi:hypothetical protein
LKIVYGTFDVIISKNPHARHIKEPEHNKAQMVHDYQENKMASTLSIQNTVPLLYIIKYRPIPHQIKLHIATVSKSALYYVSSELNA